MHTQRDQEPTGDVNRDLAGALEGLLQESSVLLHPSSSPGFRKAFREAQRALKTWKKSVGIDE